MISAMGPPRGELFLVMFELCGHCGQQKMKGLEERCLKKNSKQRATLKFFAKVAHPKTRVALERYGEVPPSWFVTGSLVSRAVAPLEGGAAECSTLQNAEEDRWGVTGTEGMAELEAPETELHGHRLGNDVHMEKAWQRQEEEDFRFDEEEDPPLDEGCHLGGLQAAHGHLGCAGASKLA